MVTVLDALHASTAEFSYIPLDVPKPGSELGSTTNWLYRGLRNESDRTLAPGGMVSPPALVRLADLMLLLACTAVEAVAIGPISFRAFDACNESNESSIVIS